MNGQMRKAMQARIGKRGGSGGLHHQARAPLIVPETADALGLKMMGGQP